MPPSDLTDLLFQKILESCGTKALVCVCSEKTYLADYYTAVLGFLLARKSNLALLTIQALSEITPTLLKLSAGEAADVRVVISQNLEDDMHAVISLGKRNDIGAVAVTSFYRHYLAFLTTRKTVYRVKRTIALMSALLKKVIEQSETVNYAVVASIPALLSVLSLSSDITVKIHSATLAEVVCGEKVERITAEEEDA